MGRRILNFGVAATHARITNLSSLEETVSASDYDAFVFDPRTLRAVNVSYDGFFRKQAEIGDLIMRKGGLLICILRPPVTLQVANTGPLDALNLLNSAAGNALNMVRQTLRTGTATVWGLLKGMTGLTKGFVGALAGHLQSEAFVQADEAMLRPVGGTIIAANSVGWPVSVEFASGPGRLCFVPVPVDIPDGQLGAAVARMVEEHFGGPVEIEAPSWAGLVSVPGADAHDAQIARLEQDAKRIAEELSRLGEEKSALLNFKVLLYGYGKSVLEPVVRRALRELGFKVLEPEEYNADWDVDLTELESGASAVGEVEGSEGPINVGKLRQLLNYVEAEEDAGRKRKGILVGNGYRLKDLNESERGSQFTEKVLREANGFGYCLLPTTELFAAVSVALKAPGDEALRKRLRDSILSTVGVWKSPEQVQAGGEAAIAS